MCLLSSSLRSSHTLTILYSQFVASILAASHLLGHALHYHSLVEGVDRHGRSFAIDELQERAALAHALLVPKDEDLLYVSEVAKYIPKALLVDLRRAKRAEERSDELEMHGGGSGVDLLLAVSHLLTYHSDEELRLGVDGVLGLLLRSRSEEQRVKSEERSGATS